jgi:hypothetical protein
VAGLFRSRAALQTEVLALRHQLNVLRRRAPKRVAVSNTDRLMFAGLYHLAPEVLDAVKLLKPETIIRWHRAGFRAWWRWKSRPRGGRPRTPDRARYNSKLILLARPVFHLETAAKLLELLEPVFIVFSKCALQLLDNQADFDSATPRFESWRPSQPGGHPAW